MKKYLVKIRRYFPWQIRFIVFYVKNYFIKLVYAALIHITNIDSNKIIVRNYDGKGFGDNAKAIIEAVLLSNGNIEVIWLVNTLEKRKTNKHIRYVKINSFSSLYHYATAKIWISNTRLPYYLDKRNNQFYIQTWHAGIGLKRVEKGAIGGLSKTYIAMAKKDSLQADLFISNSTYRSHLYRNDFWYDGKILECGLPRNDIFFKKNDRNKILRQYGIPTNKKILIYAPTFRKQHTTNIYDIDFKALKTALSKKFSEEWIILLRFHHIVSYLANEYCVKFKDDIFNITNTDDIYPLLSICDILITDYSSIMFDFMVTKRPVFIYATDINEYKKDRNFTFSFDELPFEVSRDFNELLTIIQEYKYDIKKYESFMKAVGLKEMGNASQRISEIILSIIRSNENESS